MKGNRKQLTAYAFVRAWQTASSIEAFCKKTGYPERSASARASTLRAKGIPLKKHPRGVQALNVPALASLAKDLVEGR